MESIREIAHNARMEIFLGKRSFFVFACIFLSGCKVGPNFQPPAAPQTSRYTETVIPQKTVSAPGLGGKSQTLVYNQQIPAQWWTVFHSDSLNALIQQGLAANPTLAAAQAAVRVAQQNLRAGQGALLPAATLDVSGDRIRASGANFGSPTEGSSTFNVFNFIGNLSYTLDVFGGTRRQIEALGAQLDFQQYEWEAAYLALTTSIVTTAITEASLRAQIAATRDLIREQEDIVKMVKQQFELGGASGPDVLTQETQLAQTRATLPPLEKNLAQTRDALAVLTGVIPSQSHLPHFYLSELQLPKDLPVSLPSSLVQQRPDIQASEALLHAASAQIGVATAKLFPQVTLNAYYGWTATSIGALFDNATKAWDYGADMLQTLFQGGTLIAQRRAAIAAYDQALAQYRQTVLQAFQNVADALQALEWDAKTLRAQAQAENSAHENFAMTKNQFQLGAVSYTTLLTAEEQYQQTRIHRIQAEAARYGDTAALFQALGGTWANAAKIGENHV